MKYLLSFLTLALPVYSYAQITVSPAGSPAQIATLLTGNGVTMSNVVITGATNAYGSFTAFGSTLGMNGGLLITTGDAMNVIGPNSSGSQGTCNSTIVSDPDLTTIEPMATNDVCAIEMDCVPTDDTLYFNYVFGSEEYPEYVMASFNDAFGIFVSGTNPAGGNYSAANMTVLPSGGPVSINNVNQSVNSAYYVNNVSDTTLQYDGTTVNLTAIIPVVPGQTYHLKIIVGDAGDCIYDSGVFLQAGSFRCSGLALDVQPVQNSPESVSAYPVPASAVVTYSFENLADADILITVRTLDGKTVLAERKNASSGIVSIDVSHLSPGTYLTEILFDGKTEIIMLPVRPE